MTLRTREEDIATWTSTDLCIAAPSTEESLPYKALASAVQVHVRNPDRVNGAWAEEDKLLGLVINADHGFVIVPRSFCPTDMCEVTITFLGDSDDIDAKIVYEHALGFVVVQYDTSGTEGRVKNATFSQRKLKTADETRIFAFNGAGPGVCTTKSAVAAIGSFEIAYGPERFYQPINTEVLHLETGVTCRAGMLLDDKGDIDGLWMTFFGFESISQVGVPASSLMPELECLQQGELPKECRMLDVKLTKGDRSDLRAVNISAGMRYAFFVCCSTDVSYRRYQKHPPEGFCPGLGDLLYTSTTGSGRWRRFVEARGGINNADVRFTGHVYRQNFESFYHSQHGNN